MCWKWVSVSHDSWSCANIGLDYNFAYSLKHMKPITFDIVSNGSLFWRFWTPRRPRALATGHRAAVCGWRRPRRTPRSFRGPTYQLTGCYHSDVSDIWHCYYLVTSVFSVTKWRRTNHSTASVEAFRDRLDCSRTVVHLMSRKRRGCFICSSLPSWWRRAVDGVSLLLRPHHPIIEKRGTIAITIIWTIFIISFTGAIFGAENLINLMRYIGSLITFLLMQNNVKLQHVVK